MAINSGFFNSVSGDRKYNADEISSLFTGVFKDGVFKTVGNNFMVKAYYGMTVNIDTGRAWFNRRYIENTALLPKVIDASEVLLDRIDAFVIEIDNSDSVRAGDIKYIKGTPSSDPQKPALTNTENKHQYPIAYIKVNHGVSSISDSNIEIVVGKSECPFVTGVIEGTDVDNLFVQWNAEFGEWFDTVKGQLSSDVAGNLLNMINKRGIVGTYNISFTPEGYTSQSAVFNGNLTSDDYRVYLNYSNTLTLDQIKAIGECMPWITGVSYLGYTKVDVELKSGKKPKTSFQIQVVMEYVGKSV